MSEKVVKSTSQRRRFEGTVVSAKANKSLVVAVNRTKLHSKYLKRFTVTKRYLVHDEKNAFKTGDQVAFIECRPISKNKRWRVIYPKPNA